MSEHEPDVQQLQAERWSLLEQINRVTDTPMIALSLIWLGLLIVDFTRGLGPLLQTISTLIWALFVLDFLVELTIAPHKAAYLKRNWLTAVSLMLPALRIVRIFRIFRILRAARAVRSVSLLRVVTSLNRSMRAVGHTLGRRGIGYIVALTVIVTFGGAAGMYAFENPSAVQDAGVAAGGAASSLESYGEAVWWTAMLMTTMGSEYWPGTAEGRILGWLLAVYAFAIFGYITATIASYFVGQDAAQSQSSPAPVTADDVASLRAEIAALRGQLERLDVAELPGQGPTAHRAPPHKATGESMSADQQQGRNP